MAIVELKVISLCGVKFIKDDGLCDFFEVILEST
jgi:hypothetical protein